ncbi:unnamed protein product, partial [Brassica oleracea]
WWTSIDLLLCQDVAETLLFSDPFWFLRYGKGETDEYMIFGRIGATGLFIRIFIWVLGECNWVYELLLYEILLVARGSPDWR